MKERMITYMSIFKKLLGRKSTPNNNQSVSSTAISVRNTALPSNQAFLPIHPDIRNFIWIGDGKNKNYVPTPPKTIITTKNGIVATFSISLSSDEEPSLLYTMLPIGSVVGSVERPPYYPTYKKLSPEQRGVYWKLLANPYDTTIDIGYVFLLYYGLERYLLTDNYDDVIEVILKLRDVHSNKSFQMYTANAIILTCLQRQRADIVQKFMCSLDKEYKLSFSPNLFLLCKYGLGLPLESSEVMKIAKAFEFTKNNYIKNYPDLFLNALSRNILTNFKMDKITWDHLLTDSEFKELPNEETPVFANVSIRDKTIKVPSFLSSVKLKKELYELLDRTHEDVKKQLSNMRKNDEITQKSK